MIADTERYETKGRALLIRLHQGVAGKCKVKSPTRDIHIANDSAWNIIDGNDGSQLMLIRTTMNL